jgi:hypothetical protein
MARRGWDELSPSYKRRLQRGGVGRRAYESGRSLKKARGHSGTPEHALQLRQAPTERYPGRQVPVGGGLTHPNRYVGYIQRQYPAFIQTGRPPGRPHGWVNRRLSGKQAVEYIEAIGNPNYVQAYIQPNGTVIVQIDRGAR